ncbi:hypothetical protein [Nostoc sp.]|uniref:hypothetical protein n=1 Tax=Nostoc sp. TaxID=1180 RepID=UPI002FF68298
MSNLLGWIKGIGVVMVGAIAFSGNSAIAKISQDVALPNNILNTSNFSTVLEKHNISGDNALKFNYSIDQAQIQDENVVEKQKFHSFTGVIPGKKDILLAGCGIDETGHMICKP